MNENEKIVYNWLLKKKYKPEDIKFNRTKSPDFELKDGTKIEVKTLVKKSNHILITNSQLPSLSNTIIVIVDPESKKVIGDFGLDHAVELRFENNGNGYRVRSECLSCKHVWTAKKRPHRKPPVHCPKCMDTKIRVIEYWKVK